MKNNKFLNKDQQHIYLSGEWTIPYTKSILDEFSTIEKNKNITLDVSAVSDFDSSGILLFIELMNKLNNPKVEGYTENQKKMYNILNSQDIEEVLPEKINFFEGVGKRTLDIYDDLRNFITFIGHLVLTFSYVITHPSSIRIKEIIYHIHQSGLNALIIIGLTSFLVGMVIAYQGAVQLAKFGADIFIVDTVGISIVRELGPMITAIVIAGRSGSAYTAEIGAMKITEEISAMRTMGFDPYTFLILPRVIALMIALPLLIFFADVMGILGGMVAAQMQLGISFTLFTERLQEVLEMKHYVLGMIKGPVFAFIIASIGAYRGLQVSDNTESIGLHTTASVVNSIFIVIAFDALFSIIYTGFGI